MWKGFELTSVLAHTAESIGAVVATLPFPDRELTPDQQDQLLSEINEVLVLLEKPIGYDAEFMDVVDIYTPRSKKGGRKANVSLDTALLRLADLYDNFTEQVGIADLSTPETSGFILFLNASLSPYFRGVDKSTALSERWYSLRKKIRGRS